MTGNTPESIDDSTDGTDDRCPSDLGALRRTDELLDALSDRSAVRCAGETDPALALLKALVDDVDDGAPPLSRPARGSQARRIRGRLPRTLVSLCVATTVLMTTGVAAAGGVLTPFAPAPGRSEPQLRTRPDLPQVRVTVSPPVSDSPRPVPQQLTRQAVVPGGGERLEPDDDPQGSPSLKPPKASPVPQSTPYGLYVAPGDPGDPKAPPPGPAVSPQPDVEPSDIPGQGQQEPDGAGQESPTPSGMP